MRVRRFIVYERASPMADVFLPRLKVLPAAPATPRFALPVAFALILSAVLSYAHASGTFSYFSDNEAAGGNLTAAPLAFSVANDRDSATLVLGGASVPFTLTLSRAAGSLPFNYLVSATTSGSSAFCTQIRASGAAPLSYDGLLDGMTAGPANALSPWTLSLSLPEGSTGIVDGMTCAVDLDFKAYQEGASPGTQYHDEHHVLLSLTADPGAPKSPAPTIDTGDASSTSLSRSIVNSNESDASTTASTTITVVNTGTVVSTTSSSASTGGNHAGSGGATTDATSTDGLLHSLMRKLHDSMPHAHGASTTDASTTEAD